MSCEIAKQTCEEERMKWLQITHGNCETIWLCELIIVKTVNIWNRATPF